MERLNISLLAVITILFIGGCIEIIDFDTEREGGQLVVDGNITTGEGPFTLYLGQTASLERKTVPVGDAKAWLLDSQGNSAPYLNLGEGNYVLFGDVISPQIGEPYYVRIELQNGQVYASKPEIIPPILGELDSVYFNFETEQEVNSYGNVVSFKVVNALVDVSMRQAATQTSFFRFDVEEVYRLSPTDFPDPFGAIPPPCFVYDYPNDRDFLITEVRGDRLNQLKELKVATQRLDWRFDEKHVFNVYLQSLTEEAFIYWGRVNQTITNGGTVFDTPPAPIRGNIVNVNDPDELVLGYFGAVSRDTARNFLNPDDTPFRPIFPCQYYFFTNDYPARCLDCLSLPNSTLEKPEYF